MHVYLLGGSGACEGILLGVMGLLCGESIVVDLLQWVRLLHGESCSEGAPIVVHGC